MHIYTGMSSKVKVDSIDTSNLSLSYTYFESEAFVGLIQKITHHITFIPSLDGGSVYKNIFVVIGKPDAKLPEDQIDRAKESLKKTFKAIESYVIAHPEAY
ncbi:hypothetical protein L1987_15427 [Smallanthus sonchifolius]|uniref:Uncharacterized protein n=1 Tax=Smallanthus sonchifolius TaxID=185202 RepID=A0ACB9J7R9_9ASTR|nr:hypothetical protein L1987_15427 [Smallanthus sonchifolius]